MIEKMRHLKPKPEIHERLCPFCPEHVEDEIHFLIVCENFRTHRESLFSHGKIVFEGFENLAKLYYTSRNAITLNSNWLVC